MTTLKDQHLENIRRIREQCLALLEGMDYCLDWKPGADDWSAREVVYHLVDTPEGGIGALVAGLLDGSITEFDVTPDLNNMDPRRLKHGFDRVQDDLIKVLESLEQAVANVSDDAIQNTTATAHLTARGEDQGRTPQMLLEGLFLRHWTEHLEQLRELRASLGL